MVEKNKDETEFEFDEEKALKKGFEESRAKGKLFNVTSWKLNREKLRPK
jgi:hypothetical protein